MNLSEFRPLHESLGAAVVGFVPATRNRLDAPRYGEAHLWSDETTTERTSATFEGQRLADLWDPDVPDDELNRFILPNQRARAQGLVNAQEAHRKMYGPLGLGDTLRMLVFDGALCVGWFGAVRWADATPFTAQHRQTAQRCEQEWIRRLTSQHRAKNNILEGAAAHIVCDVFGHVVAHSVHVERWLTRDRLRRVREVVGSSLAKGHARVMIGTYAWRVAQLEGSTGILVYLNAPLGSFGAVNLNILSSRQREVAHLVAVGMTSEEVGEELSISYHTVKQHLGAAYRLLGVNRREQLIKRLCR